MSALCLQEVFAPNSTCFGCGPANRDGLRIQSFWEGNKAICNWKPQQKYEAFQGYLNGGIASTLLDCHCNWAAIGYSHAQFAKQGRHTEEKSWTPPKTVTAELKVDFVAPTSTADEIAILAEVISAVGRRFEVAGLISVNKQVTVRCLAKFVAVKSDHPAHHRW
ncbi:MAG TPA: hypothetical protein PKD64_01505 [Pirellulaceae bacterium]|nr:hypothetical protein [Pirellulaceae bacterium]HMO90847.1 hypothetical protein [Pirellulaceae bacterium]HMP68677.1 hypothetical protein [Pirellulaceae bacterium]